MKVAGVASALGIPLPYENPEQHALGVVRGTAGNRCSMLQDLENHRPTEIDAINGAVVRFAEEANIPVPVNRTLTQLVKLLEAGYLENSAHTARC